MGDILAREVGSIAVCKHCKKKIHDNVLVVSPSLWFHVETGDKFCFPGIPVATPEDE
jgi:hypothetical protein